MFEFKKGLVSASALAGVLVAMSATLLVGCGEQPAPVEADPARLAANAPQQAEPADLPVVVIRARRSDKT